MLTKYTKEVNKYTDGQSDKQEGDKPMEQKTKQGIRQKIATRDMAMCALFTVLITAGAFIKIPVPVVPFTLQFLFTMMAGLLLGGRLGACSVALYGVLGLIGLPVFAEGGGIYYLLKPVLVTSLVLELPAMSPGVWWNGWKKSALERCWRPICWVWQSYTEQVCPIIM